MSITAKLSYLRITPRKVRLVADLVRGRKVEEAQNILNFTQKKAVSPIIKLLNQAVANSKNNPNLKLENLYISKILVDEGPRMKKVYPRSRGHADFVQKKSCHITLVLDEISIKKNPKIKKTGKKTVIPEKKIKKTKIKIRKK